MDIKIKKMDVWEGLYIADKAARMAGEFPVSFVFEVIKHGLEKVDNYSNNEEIELPTGHKCKVLSDKALDYMLSQKPLSEMDFYTDLMQKIAQENKLPFGTGS